ncbi:MAG: hypothetical protein KDI02_27650 [Anaerolineae bacterium]|nr:hypothetical protein [Anaerolineae bacterium]
MKNKKCEFQSHNSPWTEMFAQFCEQESAASRTTKSEQQEEQAPTQEALASVYSRLDTSRERF